ncbi:transposable element Tc1 transposase [Trichonephila clavipes]|nr:transposable element Tc1 transposase [Trichonephila clavipes]
MATTMIGYDATLDDSADIVGSKASALKVASVSIKPSSDPESQLHILAFQSVHFVDQFLTATIAASSFAQLCLYVADDVLLFGMTTQLLAFRQCDHVRCHSVTYKVFENIVMASFVFSLGNHNGESVKKFFFRLYYRFYILRFAQQKFTLRLHFMFIDLENLIICMFDQDVFAYEISSQTDNSFLVLRLLGKKVYKNEKKGSNLLKVDDEMRMALSFLRPNINKIIKNHQGWSTRHVARQVDRSECAVRNCWKQWAREGTRARKNGSGATRKTTRRENRRIVRQALVDPTVTRSMIRADVGVAIVSQTISRHLAEANLKSKRPFRALPLTPKHRQLRLQWCQARSMWNVTHWQKVVFSDESQFVLGTDDNRVRVWRRPERVAQDFLRHFQTLPWPARSPDFSPVEHVWDQLKRQMSSCHSVHDLELAVQDLWAHLPQDNIRRLSNSMPGHVVACIAAGGGPTRCGSCPVFVSLPTLYSFDCVVFEIK